MSTVTAARSNTNGPNDISLSKQLADIDKLTNYPATDLLKELLKFHQADVDHKRNIHTSAQVIQRSRLAYEDINTLITKVENSGLSDQQELDYGSWDTYTDAIPSLEDVLLQYYFKYSNKARQHVYDGGDEVLDGIHFIEEWNADRELLKTTLENLKADKLLALSEPTKANLQADYIVQRTTDDKSNFTALVGYFQKYSPTNLSDKDILDKKRGDTPVQSVREKIRDIFTSASALPHAESTMLPVLQTFMLLVIPFSLLNKQRPSTLKALGNDVKQHLASMKVWNSMKSLTTITLELVKAKPGPEQAPHAVKWEKAFKELKALLLEIGHIFINLAEDMLDLIKLSARIRSPFHERTVGLVKILRHLDIDTKSSPTDHRRQLQQTMRLAHENLSKTSNTISKDVTKVVLEDTEYKARALELSELLGAVQKTTTEVNLGDKWAERERLFNLGLQTDESHLTRMRTMFAAARAPAITA